MLQAFNVQPNTKSDVNQSQGNQRLQYYLQMNLRKSQSEGYFQRMPLT